MSENDGLSLEHRLRRARRRREACDRVSPEVRAQIIGEWSAAIIGKGIKRGDTLKMMVERHCPHIYDFARGLGCEVTFDLPENTHDAMLASNFHWLVTRIAADKVRRIG